jgi:hypothetical protein
MTQGGITSFADNKKQTLIQPDKTGANVINFFGRNLRMFLLSKTVLGKPFQLKLLFAGKATGTYPKEVNGKGST